MLKGANIRVGVRAVRAVVRRRDAPGCPDVDASALLLARDGKVRTDDDFVFYNQPRHPSGLVRHRAKQRFGPEVTDSLDVDLGALPPGVERVVIAASVAESSFGRVPGLRVLLYDLATVGMPGTQPLARFDLVDANAETALLCGELYRRDGGWKFRAIGQGYASGLVGLATDFGITVEEDEDPVGGAPVASEAASAVGVPAGGAAGAALGGAAGLAGPTVPAATPVLPLQGPQFMPR